MKTVTTWQKEHHFDSAHGDCHYTIDGNNQHGPGPKSLLLSGLASCSGIDVVDILAKMRVEFSGLTIEAEADQTEDHPRVFMGITLTFRIGTAPENEDKVRKAIDLSLEKYCGVAAMLRKNASVGYQLIIE